MAVKYAIDENKTQTIHKRITDSNGDQKKHFNIIKTLLGCQKKLVLPDYSDPITLASTFNMYFIDKIARVHYRRTHLGRWILLYLFVQTYLTCLL